jgi:hypothetical protein
VRFIKSKQRVGSTNLVRGVIACRKSELLPLGGRNPGTSTSYKGGHYKRRKSNLSMKEGKKTTLNEWDVKREKGRGPVQMFPG